MSAKPRSPGYRVLREDYVEFCQNNTVAALLLHYFESMDRSRAEASSQNETISEWRTISGKSGGRLTYMKPSPSRESVRKALDILVNVGLLEAHPDNGRKTDGHTSVPAGRYRLVVGKLRQMETAWASQMPVVEAAPPHATKMAWGEGTHATKVACPMPHPLHAHATNVAEEVLKEVLPETPDGGGDSRAQEAEEPPRPAVYGAYEAEVGPLTPFIAEQLKDWAATYTEAWVVAAIRQAVLAGVRKPNYIRAVLENWRANGFGSTPPGARSAPARTRTAGEVPTRTSEGTAVAPDTLKRQLEELKRKTPTR